MTDNPVQVLVGDCRTLLPELPDDSVQCCVTSPPYWGLRDYGTAAWEGGDTGCDHLNGPLASPKSTLMGYTGPEVKLAIGGMPFKGACGKCGAKRIDSQLGLEKTPEEYVAKMVEIFREVRRVLRKDGTLWLNLGDSYASSRDSKSTPDTLRGDSNGTATTFSGNRNPEALRAAGLKHKDLCGIPWRVAFALQADGWWLRSDIIWAKPNPMPESVTDRPTKAHEYLFLLTKSASYFYDAEAIKEASENPDDNRKARALNGQKRYPDEMVAGVREGSATYANRNKRSVWTVATAPYPEAHFATYPPDLIKPCIMAGTSAKGCCAECGAPWERVVERVVDSPRYSGVSMRNDADDVRTERSSNTLGWKATCKCEAEIQPCTVLDPFAGSGTTGMVALELGRKAILIELSPKYAALIEQRTCTTIGLALA